MTISTCKESFLKNIKFVVKCPTFASIILIGEIVQYS